MTADPGAPVYLAGLDLHGRPVLVAGAGRLASRRIPNLLAAGAIVTVVAPQACDAVARLASEGAVRWEPRRVTADDVAGCWYVQALTDDPDTNAMLVSEATDRRVFCVRGDDGRRGTARTPASGRVADLSVAVIGDRAPRRSRPARDAAMAAICELEPRLPAEWHAGGRGAGYAARMSPVRGGTDVTPPGAAPAVVRAVAVLDALAASETGSMGLSDLARELGVPKSSLSSICTALELGGLVRRDELGYELGRRTVELGGAYLTRLDQVSEFYRACEASEVFHRETVRLSAHAGTDTLCLARYEGRPAIRLTTAIGDRFPASACAQGKALLSQLDDEEIERLYHGIPELPRMTGRSRRTVAKLLKDLRQTREQGYAFDDEESADAVVGLAVAVPAHGVRSALLAVSVTKLKSTFSDAERLRMVAELRRIAHLLGNPMAGA